MDFLLKDDADRDVSDKRDTIDKVTNKLDDWLGENMKEIEEEDEDMKEIEEEEEEKELEESKPENTQDVLPMGETEIEKDQV